MLGSWYGVEKFPRDTIVTHEGLKSSLVGIPELSRADWHPEGGVVHPKVPQRLMTINKKLCKEKLGHLHIHKALARYSKKPSVLFASCLPPQGSVSFREDNI